MNIETVLDNDNILVKELFNDIPINGVMTSYDTDSPFMFCEIIGVSDTAKASLNLNGDEVLVIKRYAKEEYLSGLYFISWKDVRCHLTRESYDLMIDKGINF